MVHGMNRVLNDMFSNRVHRSYGNSTISMPSTDTLKAIIDTYFEVFENTPKVIPIYAMQVCEWLKTVLTCGDYSECGSVWTANGSWLEGRLLG